MYSAEPVLAVATTATDEADSVATVALGPDEQVARAPEQRVADDRERHKYRPFCTGTPAIPAYAIACGTISAQIVSPAIASAGSHPRS